MYAISYHRLLTLGSISVPSAQRNSGPTLHNLLDATWDKVKRAAKHDMSCYIESVRVQLMAIYCYKLNFRRVATWNVAWNCDLTGFQVRCYAIFYQSVQIGWTGGWVDFTLPWTEPDQLHRFGLGLVLTEVVLEWLLPELISSALRRHSIRTASRFFSSISERSDHYYWNWVSLLRGSRGPLLAISLTYLFRLKYIFVCHLHWISRVVDALCCCLYGTALVFSTSLYEIVHRVMSHNENQ